MDMEPENDCAWKPKQGMTFDSEQCVYDFYNTYGGRMGFSIRRDFCRKNKVTNELICRLLVCNKEGFRKGDKRDPLSKNPRAETRTGCGARLYVKLDEGSGKYVVTDFKEKHNHDLVSPECAHMLPSQRKISTTQAIQLDLAAQSGLRLGQSFELMGREAGGRQCLGFTKLDSKNYLRTKRQQSLAYGEVGNVLQYFKDKSLQNPSFFYAFQLDNEEQITNMFWADAQMIMDYAQFGDVVTFDTTYKLNKEHRPFASFVGFNHHRETVIFGAALLYDETAESFVWLFQNFLEAMSGKAPKTLFTDQDAAMAKAIPIVMPDTTHRLCTWHLMQNALKHVNCLFQDKGVKGVLNKFFFDIEDANQWKLEWAEMLDKYDAHENHWLKLTFAVKEKWGWPYVRSTWAAGMSTTQLSESFNAFLKDYIRSDFNLNEFFMHFERVLHEKRYKELEAGYALCQRLPKVKATIRMLIQMGNVYTKRIFEEFQNEYFQSIESDIEAIEYGEASTIYTVVDVGNKHARKVKMERDGSLGCNCTKFEREGILCCHSLKVIRDILKMKEVPPQYILKRWTKQARAETVVDIKGNDIEVDVKFQQASRYKTLMTAFRALASRAAETEETYDFCIAHLATLGANVEGKLGALFGVGNEVSNDHDTQSVDVDCEDVNHVVQPKGLKKKMATSTGKRRVKGGFEAALVANSKKKSRANSLASSQSIASPTVAPSPLSVGGDIYVRQHVPPRQPLRPLHHFPPSLPMGGNSIHPSLMNPTHHDMFVVHNSLPNSMPQRYPAEPTFQSLLQGSYPYDIGFPYSQQSNSPMWSQATDKHKDKQPEDENGMESEVIPSQILKQPHAGWMHKF